jgi:hypothetical protein
MTVFTTAECAFLGSAATGPDMVPATLAGHAVKPAFSFSASPADALRPTWVSGKFTNGAAPVRVPQSIETNGEMRPFFGPPLQGFSGYALVRGADGSQFALIDNGFGGKANSTDALLGFTRLLPDFETGSIEVAERVWLHDPDMRVSF